MIWVVTTWYRSFSREIVKYAGKVNSKSEIHKTYSSEVGENFEIAIESLSILIRILYPITPHITDFLWEKLGFEKINGNLNLAPWPPVDYKALIEEEVEIIIQINGKVRGKIKIKSDSDDEVITNMALNSDVFKKFSNGENFIRSIVVPNKLVNLVIKN